MICSCCSLETAPAPPPGPITATQRLAELCRLRGWNVALDVRRRSKEREIVRRRWYLAGELRKDSYSLPEIGRALGLHHTSVHHALKKSTSAPPGSVTP